MTRVGATIEDVGRELSDKPLRASSRGRDWAGLVLDEHDRYFVEDMLAPPRDHHALSVNIGDAPWIVQERRGRRFASPSLPGQATIIPAGCESRWRGQIPAHLTFRFQPRAFEEAVAEARRAGSPTVDVANGFCVDDPVIGHFTALFRLELSRAWHPTQDLMVEALGAALVLHLMRGYTDATGLDARTRSHGSAGLRRALAYIHGHPGAGVSLEELAREAGLSRFYFCRAFKAAHGVSPMTYVERERVQRAKALIRAGALSLAEIALEVGFADQSHFTRRFRTHEGCTPAVYARDRGPKRHPVSRG